MYRLRLVSASDKFKFIDVIGERESIVELAVYIQVIKKIHLPADAKQLYWNLEGIYTVDGAEVSKSLGISITNEKEESHATYTQG